MVIGDFIELTGTGPDQVWDASEATTNAAAIVTHLEPADGQATASLPGTDMVQLDGGLEYYYDIAEDGLYLLGSYNPNFPITSVYSNPQKLLEFPCILGTSWSDIYTGSYTYQGITYEQSGNSTYEAVGYGTLQLPWGDVENVLRIDVSDVYEESGNGNEFIYTTSSSFYYKPGVGFYVGRSLEASGEFNGTSTGTTRSFVFQEEFETGVDERLGNSIGVEAFPVPAQDRVSLLFTSESARELLVRDAAGRAVMHRSLANKGPGLYKEELDLTGLANGLYTAVIIGSHGVRGSTRFVVDR